jgi:hypothetical protein
LGGVIAVEVMGGYGLRLDPPEVVSRVANAARTWRSRTPARLHVYDTILQRLGQNLEDMPAGLGEFIQEEHAVAGQREFPAKGAGSI